MDWLRRASDAVLKLVPVHRGVKRVFLFGSITAPGRFGPHSDIDVAIACDSVEQESGFWRALEDALHRDVDVRSLTGPIAETALRSGVHIYG